MVFASLKEERENSDESSLLVRVEALERAALSSLTGLAALDQRLGIKYQEFASVITGLSEELSKVRELTGAQARRTAELDGELRDFQALIQEEWWRLASPKSNGECPPASPSLFRCRLSLGPADAEDSDAVKPAALAKGDGTAALAKGNGTGFPETSGPLVVAQESSPEGMREMDTSSRPASPMSTVIEDLEDIKVMSDEAPVTAAHDVCQEYASIRRVSPPRGPSWKCMDDELHARIERLSAISQKIRAPCQDVAAPEQGQGETVASVATPSRTPRSEIPDTSCGAVCLRQPEQKAGLRQPKLSQNCTTSIPTFRKDDSSQVGQRSELPLSSRSHSMAHEGDLCQRLSKLEKLVERLCCTAGRQTLDQPEELRDLRSRVELAEKALLAAADKLGFLAHLVAARHNPDPNQGGA